MEEITIGFHRRIFNKNLKDAILRSGLTAAQIRKETGIIETVLSQIINFHYCPDEDKKIKLAIVLNVSIDSIFPERYEELYEKINPLARDTETTIKMMALDSPDVLMLDDGNNPDEKASRFFINKEMMALLESECTEKELEIMKYRYGFDDVEHTLEETAWAFGVTRERIRQREAKVLEKLREKLPDTIEKFEEIYA